MHASRSDRKPRLLEVFSAEPELAGTLELVWRQAQASFPEPRLEEWLAACRVLAESAVGSPHVLAYIRHAPAVAAVAGVDAALALGEAVPEIAAQGGAHAAVALIAAAPKASRRLGTGAGFAEWLRVVRLVAAMAPESLSLLLDRAETVLQDLDLRGFEAWALGGIRTSGGNAEKRLKFFALLDPQARRLLTREADEVQFADIERQLRAYVIALWRMAPPLRTLSDGAFDRPRRANFEGSIIRLPESFRGYSGRSAAELFHAAIAHIGAHLQFSRTRFPVGSLKPVQVALVSLIEDARVEHLAMEVYPGLRRLWLPFHVASAAGAITAPALMARLARGLIDSAYADDNGWVQKGREMFFAATEHWRDPGISRKIGGLLGNDLGQMRAQFNAKTYSVEPPYRDDNQGLWDFGESAAGAEAETLLESVRLEQIEEQEAERKRQEPQEPTGEEANHAALVPAETEIGIPVARYPEWDFLIARDRAEWTTVVEYEPNEGKAGKIDDILEHHSKLVHRITTLIRSAKVSRPLRLRRQPEGDRLDLEACIDAAIDRRVGGTPDPKVYARLERRFRDLSVLLLLDVSQSSNDIVRGAGRSVLDLERDAAALLAHAMDGLGDPFAIHAFCSDTRDDVHYYRIKDFAAPYGGAAKRRLAGLTGRFSTRMGAALRHAGRELADQMSYRRLLLMISDGEPSDVDVADRRYLVEDARRAVLSMSHLGIDVFCVGLDAGGDSYLTRIFGRRNVVQVDRVERLPEKLPMLYFRLTA